MLFTEKLIHGNTYNHCIYFSVVCNLHMTHIHQRIELKREWTVEYLGVKMIISIDVIWTSLWAVNNESLISHIKNL